MGSTPTDTVTSATITSQEIVTKYSISYQTLNYYTNLGFFNAFTKQGNRRLYREEEVRKTLSAIRQLKLQGFSLRLIGRFIKAGQGITALETLMART